MKKIIFFSIAIIGCFLCASLIIAPGASQTKSVVTTAQVPIPDDVAKIFAKSCNECHANPGKGGALMALNLSNWDKMSTDKQASVAARIGTMVKKDKMPPFSYKEDHPEKVLNKDEIKTICDWADSLQIKK